VEQSSGPTCFNTLTIAELTKGLLLASKTGASGVLVGWAPVQRLFAGYITLKMGDRDDEYATDEWEALDP
jgi:hypothetical protein